jgi:pimeloyl-ACP methyl ester carboxylesterase
MQPRILFLGGNGHAAGRLAPARAALAKSATFTLVDVPYPGFEGRPRAADLEAFLNDVSDHIAAHCGVCPDRVVVYATGIGGLLALCLRGRGEHLDVPLLLQAPVLWGLEHRLMPGLMRLGLARRLLVRLFGWSLFQRRFARKYFERPVAAEVLKSFFRGYAECAAVADFFAWLTPALLRHLEEELGPRPSRLQRIRVWWGERDKVVTTDELEWTKAALDVSWPLRTFPTWGHYPMIDEPDEWVRALSDELATPGTLL